MNALSFPRVHLPAVNDDDEYCAACAVLADRHLGEALDMLADRIGEIYGQRRALTEAEHKAVAGIRNAMVSIAHARNLLAPLMIARGPAGRLPS